MCLRYSYSSTAVDPLIVMCGQEKMRLEKNFWSMRDSWSHKCPIPQCTELSFHMSSSRTNMSFGLWEILVWNQKTLSKVPEFQIQNPNTRSIMENTKYLLSNPQAQETTRDAETNMSKLRINFQAWRASQRASSFVDLQALILKRSLNLSVCIKRASMFNYRKLRPWVHGLPCSN